MRIREGRLKTREGVTRTREGRTKIREGRTRFREGNREFALEGRPLNSLGWQPQGPDAPPKSPSPGRGGRDSQSFVSLSRRGIPA